MNTLAAVVEECHCTSFRDTIFAVRNGINTAKELTFSAAPLQPSQPHLFSFPDKDGTVAMLSDIPEPRITFEDNEFLVFDDIVPTKVMKFNATDINIFTDRTSFPVAFIEAM